MQQDSWQLELIISGFAIFLMIGALGAIFDYNNKVNLIIAGMGRSGKFVYIAWMVLISACLFFIINLILHVLLRGMWISAIGLRSVSGNVNLDYFRFSGRFDRFLRGKIGNFDNYIERLENLCSIIFAFTFLNVFMLLALGIWSALVGFLLNSLQDYLPQGVVRNIGFFVVMILLITSGVLYFLDFVTLGYLKRLKWLQRIYYPVYRFYSFITLASLYRPIYYNLIDNKFGRRVGFLLVPYAASIIFIASFRADAYVWFPEERKELELRRSYYDDLREEKTLVTAASLPSRFVSNGFLELFIRYIPSEDDKTLDERCPDFRPLKEPGISTDIVIVTTDATAEWLRSAPPAILQCFSELYEIKVGDSIFQAPGFRFYQHPNAREKGIVTVLDVEYLPRGEHEILINKWRKMRLDGQDTIALREHARFPFWKE